MSDSQFYTLLFSIYLAHEVAPLARLLIAVVFVTLSIFEAIYG